MEGAKLIDKKYQVVIGHKMTHQVVFLGPFGVWKTTALRVVSDIDVVSTDVKTKEVELLERQEGKTTTTTGLDYGELKLSEEEHITLIGVPGQERFQDTVNALIHHASACVLWMYGDRDESLAECKNWLNLLKKHGVLTKMSMVVTRTTVENRIEKLKPFRELLSQYHPLAPVMTGDPRNKLDVIQSIVMALATPQMKVGA